MRHEWQGVGQSDTDLLGRSYWFTDSCFCTIVVCSRTVGESAPKSTAELLLQWMGMGPCETDLY